MNERTVKEETKLIPYGMMNFVAIREDNFYYVDKTRFIEKIEQSNKYIFFYRPRRPHPASQGLCRLSRSGDGGL